MTIDTSAVATSSTTATVTYACNVTYPIPPGLAYAGNLTVDGVIKLYVELSVGIHTVYLSELTSTIHVICVNTNY